MFTVANANFIDEQNGFETEAEAIDYINNELPSDDFIYVVIGPSLAIVALVHGGIVYRPV